MPRVDQQDTITLRLPASLDFADLPRVGLAALLRIHRIDPGDVGDLATSVHEIATKLAAAGVRGGGPSSGSPMPRWPST